MGSFPPGWDILSTEKGCWLLGNFGAGVGVIFVYENDAEAIITYVRPDRF